MAIDITFLTEINVLRARRLSMGISLQELSDEVDVSSSHLAAFEAGNVEMDLRLFSSLSRALGSESGKLMHQAESLEYEMTPREKRLMVQTLQTQKQRYKIEQQLLSLASQRLRMIWQLESMQKKNVNVAGAERLAHLLDNQKLTSQEATQRLTRLRKASEESERFLLRTLRSFCCIRQASYFQ